MTTEAEFYAARRVENGWMFAKRRAPQWRGTSRRSAKQGGSRVWLKDSKVIDMNWRPINPPKKH